MHNLHRTQTIVKPPKTSVLILFYLTVLPFIIEKKMTKLIQFFELNTGAKIPSVGLGTWQAEPGVVAKAVTTAIQVIKTSLQLTFSPFSIIQIPKENFCVTKSYCHHFVCPMGLIMGSTFFQTKNKNIIFVVDLFFTTREIKFSIGFWIYLFWEQCLLFRFFLCGSDD